MRYYYYYYGCSVTDGVIVINLLHIYHSNCGAGIQ